MFEGGRSGGLEAGSVASDRRACEWLEVKVLWLMLA